MYYKKDEWNNCDIPTSLFLIVENDLSSMTKYPQGGIWKKKSKCYIV